MLTDIVASAGTFESAAVMGVFGSDTLATVAVTAVGVPRCTVTPPVMLSVGALLDVVTVRFASLRSKKILPTASSLMRPCVVAAFAVLGIVTTAEPLFGALATSTKGKEFPPSVEREIFTFAQLTGATFVFATDHVIVGVDPPASVCA